MSERLDQAEQVVPAARVEPGAVLTQLVEDLLHLEGGGDRLDQDGGPDGAARYAEQLLGPDEDVVPQSGLVAVLQLGQIEVRAVPGVDLALGAVEEVQTEVDQRGGHRPPLELQVLFVQMPAARPDHDRGEPLAEPVLPALRGGEVDPALDGVEEVQLAADDVVPQRGRGVLEVGHPDTGTGVEGVDRHPAVRWAGDLDPPVGQAGRGRCDPPAGVVPDGGGDHGEVER